MTPYKQIQEATAEDILALVDVKLVKRQEKGWVKAIILTDKTGQEIPVRLFWDDDDGYRMFGDEPVPAYLWELTNRPEFEYILDSLTNEVQPPSVVDLVRKYNDGVENLDSLAPTAEATLDLISINLRKLGHYV
jgi:hypothetical protein